MSIFDIFKTIREEKVIRDGKETTISIVRVQEQHGADYYVYVGSALQRVCPSIGMADEIYAGL